jgi:hypothetical protein
MKRAVLMTILLTLSYQFAWAGVSLYCTHHETGQAATHFGHHSHDHVSRLDAETPAPSPETGLGVGADHDHCDSTLALNAVPILISAPPPSAFLLPSAATPHDFATAEPDRPNWTAAA